MASGNRLKIAICGKSGLVGEKLDEFFGSIQCDVVGVKIRNDTSIEDVAKQIEKCDALINLSGATILAHWSDTYKKILYESRINTTKKLVDALELCKEKPKLFLSASAVGIYASGYAHNEESQNYAGDFLSKVCQDWEAEALRAEEFEVRVALMRFGVIYAKKGGAMDKILPPFKLGVGGKLGSGEQIVSWIHIEDLVRAVHFIMKTPDIRGAVNFTSPYPLSNDAQTKIMGSVLHRPTILGVPKFALKLVFGEGASVMLDSKEIYPKKLQDAGFEFYYEKFEDAFKDIVQ